MLETCYEYINVSKKNLEVGNYELAHRQACHCQEQIENLFNVSNVEVQIKLLDILYQSSKIISNGYVMLCCQVCALREVRNKMIEYQTIYEQDAYEPKIREVARFYHNKLERDLRGMMSSH